MKNFFHIDKSVLHDVLVIYLQSIAIVLTMVIIVSGYIFGYRSGYTRGFNEASGMYTDLLLPSTSSNEITQVSPTKTQVTQTTPKPSWGGPELWAAVNKRRQELGVNQLSQKDELCTIASIRLNELLELGRLDGHEGFGNMKERRPDLKDIFENYSNVSEFLAYGGESASETVSLWENTLAHKKILTGGEYVWGCIYAQNSFAVAITAF